MLPLPILDVHLQPCSEDWQQMTPTAQGRHCASCQRTVVDFTDKTQTDLEAARTASPDGRLCGRFRAAQLAQPPRLRPRLRRFLVALVLVCGLGLTSGEAWAQVRETGKEAAPVLKQVVFGSVEQMPVYRGGQEALLKFIATNFQRPVEAPTTLNGRIFVRFQITETGAVRDVQIAKGLHPLLDVEAMRVVQLLDGHFEPGQQNNRPIAVGYTIPITIEVSEAVSKPRKRRQNE